MHRCCPKARSITIFKTHLVICVLQYKYSSFEDSFRQMLKDAENSADVSKRSSQPALSTKVNSEQIHQHEPAHAHHALQTAVATR